MATPCSDLNLHFSKLEIKPDEKSYLKTMMGFSYGENAEKYMKEIKSAKSMFYYKSDKEKPEFTVFSSTYENAPAAQVAYEHLKGLWGTSNQHEVFLDKTQVIWFGNVRLADACFKEWVSNEKSKVTR